jgi:GAF domain-containing protein/HAMP domain-containing protein
MKITTRLILSFLIVTILPLAVMGYAGLRMMDRISIVALEGTTKGLKQMAEDSIHQQALNVARQVELYLEAHPELLTAPAKELEANKGLAALAVRPVGKTGYTALYDSDAVTHFHTNPALIGADLHTLASTLPEFWRIMDASLSGTPVDGYYKWKEADGSFRDKYMSCVPVGKTRFRVAATTYIDEFLQPIQNTRTEITGISQEAQRSLFIAMGVSGGIAVLVAALLAMIIVRPLRRVTEGARRFSEGRLDQEIRIGSRDEIGQLAATLNQMAQQLGQTLQEKDHSARQLNDLNQRLEQQVIELERRAAELQVLHEFTLRANTQTDTAELLRLTSEQAVALLGAEVGGVYVYDPQLDRLTLSVAVGPFGDFMGATLKPGEGLAGKAFEERRSMTVEDYGAWAEQAATYEKESRFKATLAVPLVGKEGVLGVLDIGGGTQKPAFDDRDVRLAELFAAQAAGALENVRLLQQTRTALKELEASNRLLVREGWQGYLEQETTRRAEFLAASGPVQAPLQGKAAPETEPLTIPLELRGQSLGRLTLRREGGAAWSDDELEIINAIALQTSLAADNARLIEETQRTLGETRALYETSREITSAGETSEVLAAVLNNLAHTGIHAAAVALFDAPTREQAKNIEMAGTWDHTGTPRLAPGVRFEIASFPLFNRITSEKALVSQDLLSDPAIDDMAKALLGGLGLRAMALTPLVARGQWIGVLFALMETPHTFTPSELNFHRALADQAAIAIDSRRLLAETQHRAEREALIRQITTRIRAASDIQGVLETTATELARSMGVSRSIVRLTMGDSA